MDVVDKLDILSRDAQYDLSCACSTKNPAEHRKRDKDNAWLYPVTVANGGSGIMLKTLMTNSCSNDCLYCPLRNTADSPRTGIGSDELASFFIDLAAKRHLIGLFLSSGVMGTADRTMDKLTATAEILRKKYRYRGYIHIKIIPGCSKAAIDKTLSLASAVSLNIETPGANRLARLSQSKNFDRDIIEPLKYISEQTAKGSRYAKIHKTSQFIVGASDETDREILSYTWGMYRRLNFHRLYFSAYQGGLGDPSIPGEQHHRIVGELRMQHSQLFALPEVPSNQDILMREHRLYQSDYLFRCYGFTFDDIDFDQSGNLLFDKDPKQLWADRHPEYYPVSLSKGSKEALLRVPGLGPIFVGRIIKGRSTSIIRTLDDVRLPSHLAMKAKSYICA
ncbi:MAG: radical SAM protein [Sphaerochaetaceae bacterium]|jgi:predicted DNA-binding helix-hairpin-helix protein|nr:radical SAM protein [Sphaerochaetaceae bacterium]